VLDSYNIQQAVYAKVQHTKDKHTHGHADKAMTVVIQHSLYPVYKFCHIVSFYNNGINFFTLDILSAVIFAGRRFFNQKIYRLCLLQQPVQKQILETNLFGTVSIIPLRPHTCQKKSPVFSVLHNQNPVNCIKNNFVSAFAVLFFVQNNI